MEIKCLIKKKITTEEPCDRNVFRHLYNSNIIIWLCCNSVVRCRAAASDRSIVPMIVIYSRDARVYAYHYICARVYIVPHRRYNILNGNFSLSLDFGLFSKVLDVADLHKTHRWKFVNVINAAVLEEFAQVICATPPCRAPELLIPPDRDKTFC